MINGTGIYFFRKDPSIWEINANPIPESQCAWYGIYPGKGNTYTRVGLMCYVVLSKKL
jgi:ribosomal protein L24E